MFHSKLEKGGLPEKGINLALCENPLPPLDEAIEAARNALPKCNHYTEPYSQKLKERISDYVGTPARNIHINAGSELILRQLFSKYGGRVHLITPTYYLFEEIAESKSYTELAESDGFRYDVANLQIPKETTLAVIINPNNPTGTRLDIKDNLELVRNNPKTIFLIDEAFIEFVGGNAVDLVSDYDNVAVTRTFSKAFSLAGMRAGYLISNRDLVESLDNSNDAYPLGRVAERAAIASLENVGKIKDRVAMLKKMTSDLAKSLQDLGIVCYPTETYFFLIKVPFMDPDQFTSRLAQKNIHVRPISIGGTQFIRFASSTEENNKVVIDAIKEIKDSISD